VQIGPSQRSRYPIVVRRSCAAFPIRIPVARIDKRPPMLAYAFCQKGPPSWETTLTLPQHNTPLARQMKAIEHDDDCSKATDR